jgi:hypothetical protein
MKCDVSAVHDLLRHLLMQTATGLASVGYGSRAFWSRFTTEAERKLLSFNFYQLGQLLAAVGGC